MSVMLQPSRILLPVLGAAAPNFFAGLTTVLPVPKLGITSAVRSAQDLPGTGEWISHPEKVIAFGFLYFLFSGISELFNHGWMAQTRTRTNQKSPSAPKAA